MELQNQKGSIIVAASENNVIGKNNTLPWRLPADLKRFKQLTSGHAVIMGRKTFESIGKPLPNRKNIIVTRDIQYSVPAAYIAHSLNEAVALCHDDTEPFFIGGSEIFRSSMQFVQRIYLTLVHTQIDGDVFLEPISPEVWDEVYREAHRADEKNEFDYSFINYQRKEK